MNPKFVQCIAIFFCDTMTAAVCAAIPAEQRSKSLQLVTAAAI
jgi:hypothetical protein